MINLEAFGESGAMATVAGLLEDTEGVSHVRLAEATRPGHSIVIAVVRPRAVDALMQELRRLGVREADVTLTRAEVVGRAGATRPEVSLVWEDVLGAAWLNARPIARYLAFMCAAGVIGCYGVIDSARS